MQDAAIITGLGLITPLGTNAAQTWDALLAGRSISDHSRVNLPEPGDCSRVSRLAIHAAREAIAHAGWMSELLCESTTALIVGTSKGSIEDWTTAGRASTSLGLSEIACDVANHCKITSGPRLTLSAACASGLHALIRATMMIRSGEIERALVIAAEASVTPLFVNSFKRLGILAPEGYGCRPFDENRRGFVISECAAAICLERASENNLSKAFARVDRFAIANDATHITRSDDESIALRHVLNHVISTNAFDLIHAHGTGTQINDTIELSALETTLHRARPFTAGQSQQSPTLYSHKGALGHSLGASGLVSIVLNSLAHKQSTVPGNIRTANPMRTQYLALGAQPTERPVCRSLAIAAGFGGSLAAVSLCS